MAEAIRVLYSDAIQENLFPDNAFYKQSLMDGTVEPNVKKMVIPQAGANPDVGVNVSSFPLDVEQRTDDIVEYDIDLFNTPPIHIEDENEHILSYSKWASVYTQHSKALETRFAAGVANKWASDLSAHIIRTTGADTGYLAHATATGTRKAMTLDDWINAARILDNMDAPAEDRFALLPANMYAELLKAAIPGFIGADKMSTDLLKPGVVGELFGFQIYKRSSVACYSNLATPVKKAVGAAEGATDNNAAIFWQKDFVRRAEGNFKAYIETDKPEYLGGLMNGKVRGGAVKGRKDGSGVVTLVQAHG